MIVKIDFADYTLELLFGFEVLKKMSEGQAKGQNELEVIAECGLAAINTMRKRKGEDPLPANDYYVMMDDLDFMFQIKEAVEKFSENFSKAAEKRNKAKK